MTRHLRVTLGEDVKPWIVPNYMSPADKDGSPIHVADLSDGSLDVAAQDFINRLYENAGRRPPVLTRTQ